MEVCRWPDALDWYQVATTPLVADFDFDDDPTTTRPSIVFSTVGSGFHLLGNLFIIDGGECLLQYGLWESHDRLSVGVTPALGDLDGDGRPEIVLMTMGAVLVALRHDRSADRFQRFWSTPVALATREDTRVAPAIHDIDGDAAPEVLLGGRVLDGRTGALRLTPPAAATAALVADVDGDGIVELVGAAGTWEPSWSSGGWSLDPRWVGPGVVTSAVPGLALADFGDFGEGPAVAELVVVSERGMAVRGIDGRPIWGPRAAPSNGRRWGASGAPLVADVDGDGTPEVGVAAFDRYLLFDRECEASPLPAHCQATGIRWTQPFIAPDGSVGAVGFDFDGDGVPEIAHADNCFVRIVEGITGRVLASMDRSAGAGLEYATIADVNDDGSAEIVASFSAGSAPRPGDARCLGALPDPSFSGPSCADDRPCPTPIYQCVDGTCRTFLRDNEMGIRVYGERDRRWAGARPVWNQYDYRVTHVNADATIPSTPAWTPNYAAPGRNDFRAQAADAPVPFDAVDFTLRPRFGWTCDGEANQWFEVDLCNRGVVTAEPGVGVTFSSPDGPICAEQYTTRELRPGDCESFVCRWSRAPRLAVPVEVRVEPGHQLQCATHNDAITFTCD